LAHDGNAWIVLWATNAASGADTKPDLPQQVFDFLSH
jgi:hypothetical protein